MIRLIKKQGSPSGHAKAGVNFENGVIIIDLTYCTLDTKHYNVLISFKGGNVIVRAEKPTFALNGVFGNKVSPEKVVDEDIRIVKSFWTRKEKKVAKIGWVELKERKHVVYEATRYLIKNSHPTF